jgi:hypothetical protein
MLFYYQNKSTRGFGLTRTFTLLPIVIVAGRATVRQPPPLTSVVLQFASHLT